MSNRATLHWPCGDTQGLFRFSSQGSHKGCPYQMTNRGSHIRSALTGQTPVGCRGNPGGCLGQGHGHRNRNVARWSAGFVGGLVCGFFGCFARPGLAGMGLASRFRLPFGLNDAWPASPASPGRIVRVWPRAPLAGQPLPPAPWAYARLPLPIAQVALARAPLRSGAFSAKSYLFAAMIHTPKALGVERVACVQGQARYRSAVQSSCMIQVRGVFYGLSIG